VVVGQILTAGTGQVSAAYFAMAAAFFVCGLGNIINDIGDIEADRINHPRRVLPSGRISVARARTLAFMFLIVSLILAIPLNGPSRLIVIAAMVLVIIYNIRLKNMPYTGNVAVSILGALTFLLGAATYGAGAILSVPGAMIAAVFAFLMHLGREIIKDIEDRAGDSAAGRKTAPLVSGGSGPAVIEGVVMLALIVLSLLVYFRGWFDIYYLYILVVLIHLPLIASHVWLWTGYTPEKCRVVSMIIKIQMGIGLIALILGKDY